mmetsp:Transcript_21022/g.57934  ORF Transcript_21022/g.57934 Transcript_21022/m.57934 type:complete len:265 (+) Transcript_21022:55-849(+)
MAQENDMNQIRDDNGEGFEEQERRMVSTLLNGEDLVSLLLPTTSEGSNLLANDSRKDKTAANPLHLVEAVAGVAEDGNEGREDLASGGHSREQQRRELGNSVVDEALAESGAQGEGEKGLDELLAALAERQTRGNLVGGEAEDQGNDSTRKIGVQHRFEGAELRVLLLASFLLGLLFVHLLDAGLDTVLDATCGTVEREREGNEGQSIGRIRLAALAVLHRGPEVENDDTESHHQHLKHRSSESVDSEENTFDLPASNPRGRTR